MLAATAAASFGNFTPAASRVWLKSNGAIHGAKIANTTNRTVTTSPTRKIQRARPLVFQICLMKASSCQYRTLGSMSALMMSTARLDTTTTTAKNVTRPCTAM